MQTITITAAEMTPARNALNADLDFIIYPFSAVGWFLPSSIGVFEYEIAKADFVSVLRAFLA